MESGTVHPEGVQRLSVDERTDRAVATVDHLLKRVRIGAWEAFSFLRYLLFIVYLLLAAIGFWLTALSAVFGTLRILVRLAKVMVLYLAGGHPPPPEGRAEELAEATKQEIHRLWDTRLLLYADIARPVARHYVGARVAVRRFWWWTVPRKLVTVVFTLLFVGVPLTYIVPRPHEVQITDDNAISHEGEIRYLIHAVDMDDPTRFREYENEIAVYLGKINPQGLKSKLQNGRFYRLWVVGLRWWYFPALYPNIIWATEIDQNGVAISSNTAAPATTPNPD